MEVHHHPAHTHEKRNWKSYFWEFWMLFLAVTLGTFVENQREHYIEHQRAKEFSKSLIQDLQNDITALEAHDRSASIYISIADSLLKLNQTRLEGIPAAQFSFYTRFMYWTVPIVWNRSTFEQIKNSGGLRYFKNDQLRDKMMKYDAVVNDINSEADNHKIRGNLLINHINEIMDPAYHQALSKYFLLDLDTMSLTTIKSLYPSHPESLENKRNEIRPMLNMVVVQQRNLRRNIETSWQQAQIMAKELVGDLKLEFHL